MFKVIPGFWVQEIAGNERQKLRRRRVLLEDEADRAGNGIKHASTTLGFSRGFGFNEFLCSGQEGLGEVVLSWNSTQ